MGELRLVTGPERLKEQESERGLKTARSEKLLALDLAAASAIRFTNHSAGTDVETEPRRVGIVDAPRLNCILRFPVSWLGEKK